MPTLTPIPALAPVESRELPEDLPFDEPVAVCDVDEVVVPARCSNPSIGAEAGVKSERSLCSHSTHRPDARPVKNPPDVDIVWLPLMYHVGIEMICPHWKVVAGSRVPVVDAVSVVVINSMELVKRVSILDSSNF